MRALLWMLAACGLFACSASTSPPGLYDTCTGDGECTEGECIPAIGDVGGGGRMICSLSCTSSSVCPAWVGDDGARLSGVCTTVSSTFPDSPGVCRAGCSAPSDCLAFSGSMGSVASSAEGWCWCSGTSL